MYTKLKNIIASIFLFLVPIVIGTNLNAQERVYTANILDVYDGDTVTALVNLGFDTYTLKRLRLNRINASKDSIGIPRRVFNIN